MRDKENPFDPNREKILVVLGGSFNPPTLAHQALMEHALAHVMDGTGQAARGLYVPSSDAYVRRKLERHPGPAGSDALFSEKDRAALLQDTCGSPLAGISETEFGDDGRGNTYRTLCRIRDAWPGWRIMFLTGADKLRIIPKWRDKEKLLSEFTILATCRDEDDAEAMVKADPRLSGHIGSFWFIPELGAEYKDISSTKAREAISRADWTGTARLCGYRAMKRISEILAETDGKDRNALATALINAGAGAVEAFTGHPVSSLRPADIVADISETMDQMPEDELRKSMALYGIG